MTRREVSLSATALKLDLLLRCLEDPTITVRQVGKKGRIIRLPDRKGGLGADRKGENVV